MNTPTINIPEAPERQEQNLLSINQTLRRAKARGIGCTEYALRKWVKAGELPSRQSGNKTLIYWPAFVKFVTNSAEEKAPCANPDQRAAQRA